MKAAYSHKRQYMTCPACGKVHSRPASWRNGDYCSRECYHSILCPRLGVTEEDVRKAAKMYHRQKDAAKALKMSYVRFRRIVKQLGLRDEFLPRGGAATWGN